MSLKVADIILVIKFITLMEIC